MGKTSNFEYYFIMALAPPDNQGAMEGSYQLSKSEYELVKKQILSKDSKIKFIQFKDGEPICFSVSYPVVYVTTRKEKVYENIIKPDAVSKIEIIKN